MWKPEKNEKKRKMVSVGGQEQRLEGVDAT